MKNKIPLSVIILEILLGLQLLSIENKLHRDIKGVCIFWKLHKYFEVFVRELEPDFWIRWPGGVLLWRGWRGTLKRVVCFFEEDCMVLWRGWCSTSTMIVWYFEEESMVLKYIRNILNILRHRYFFSSGDGNHRNEDWKASTKHVRLVPVVWHFK